MIPLVGKPILEHLIQDISHRVKEILIVVNYRKEMIERYFSDGSDWGLNIKYLFQKNCLGTADAVKCAKEFVDNSILVINGDLLIDSSAIDVVLNTYKKNGLTTLSAVPIDNPEQYGVVTLKDGYVNRIKEKPKKGTFESNLINAGIYVFDREIYDEIEKTPKSSRGEIEITETIQRLIDQKAQIVPAMIDPGKWMDIGFPWNLLEGNRRLLEKTESDIKGTVEEGAHLVGPVNLRERVRVRSGSYIEGPVFIDEHSDIGSNCHIRPFTSIGKNVRIENACEIKNCLIMDDVYAGHLSYIGDSIIGESSNIGAGTITGNLGLDKRSIRVEVKGELIDSGLRKLGVIMGDKVETGIGVNIMPGVKIGSSSLIGPNVTLFKDVESEVFVKKIQKLDIHNKL
jgi:bifunctional UDP-N-acetylglucosamine pyrophosphorylase/glucosamine-1-phosphate N-acetyltransferase